MGDHKWVAGTEFLASNERDWAKTPFDDVASDLMIAYGTNSSWEIAANKRVQKLIIADWSPLPILAQAYIIQPLLKISATPQQFLAHLSLKPRVWYGHSMDDQPIRNLLLGADQSSGQLNATKVRDFLEYLEQQPEITTTELRFLSEYFWSRVTLDRDLSGPFAGLRDFSFLNLLGHMSWRYDNLTP